MHRLRLLAPAALLLACPQAQPTEDVEGTPSPAAADPRVVNDSSDLYVGKAPAPQEIEPRPAEAGSSPGTGRPDETNGTCRLYAPELREPACCEHPLGFDVAAAQESCGLQLYLGESFHNTCGFYFLREPGASPTWFRLSVIRGESPRAAADEHALIMRRTSPGIAAEPVPGVPGALWVKQDEYRWAFLPGWKSVRLLAWKDTSCADDRIAGLLRAQIAVPEHATGPRRRGLLPAATPGP